MAHYDKSLEWNERHIKRLRQLHSEGASVPRMKQALPGFSTPRIKAKLKELNLSLDRAKRPVAEKIYG